ncbi:MAG: hypothetical protein IKL59_04470, partial [Clostridia bacterium]|nr:hypothetical protein [Clostridia bacterium]
MKTKASKRLLSIFLTVLMIMSSASMIFAYAETADPNAPKAYDSVEDGEKLWDVDFSSQYFTAPNDMTEVQNVTGGTVTEGALATSRWRAALTDIAVVVEENGKALKIDADEVNATGNQYSGFINSYSLENSTYTYEFEYFRTNSKRSKVYFGYSGTNDSQMACWGIEPTANNYVLRRNGAAATAEQNKYSFPMLVKDTTSTEYRQQMKIVLSGGTVNESGNFTGTNCTWTGATVPVDFAIYAKDPVSGEDILVYKGSFVQPAAIGLVFGIGEFDKISDTYYGARNLSIYKGDTSNAFDYKALYDNELTTTIHTVDFNHLSNYKVTPANVSINAAGTQLKINGASNADQRYYTYNPMGDDWDYGIYEYQFALNAASRFQIGLFNLSDAVAAGFAFAPNGDADSLAAGEAKSTTTYQNVWFSEGTAFSLGSSYLTTKTYDTYTANSDPRILRNYSTSDANVKIVVNAEENVVTLFEKEGNTWYPISMIDYNKAVDAKVPMSSVIAFRGYNANTLAEVNNLKIVKGVSVDHTCADHDYDKDHICDVCSGTAGTHAEQAESHLCAHCGKTAGECRDVIKVEGYVDHNCDVCGEPLTVCKDTNNDDLCDICGESFIHSEIDDDRDHACDICGDPMGEHQLAADKHACDYCGENIGTVVDFTTNDAHYGTITESEFIASEDGSITFTNKAAKASTYDTYMRDYKVPGHVYEIEYWIEVSSFNYRVGFQPINSPSLDGYTTGSNVRLGWTTAVSTKSPNPANNDYVSRLANGSLKGSVILAQRDTDTANNNRQYFKIIVDGINDKMTLYVKYNGEFVAVDTINLDMTNSTTQFLKPTVYVFDAVPEGEYATVGGVTVYELCDVTGDADHTCDICGTAYPDTHNAEHYCAICGTIGSACADTETKDHKCDTCGAVISECTEGSTVDHKCDVCAKELTELHTDTDNNHFCDLAACNKQLSTCVDEKINATAAQGSDHKCDICNAVLGACGDEEGDGDHECDVCGAIVSVCVAEEDDGDCTTAILCGECDAIMTPAKTHIDVETDNDHKCDNAGCNVDNITEHTDGSDSDHLCDNGCGKIADEGCYDVNPKDHVCDECGAAYKADEHKDGADNDHLCDYCNGSVGEDCYDVNPKDHVCDECGAAYKAEEHKDNNKDHKCDYGCDVSIGDHVDGNDADHLCDHGCGKVADDGCYDSQPDGKCDECGLPVEHICLDNDKNHECDLAACNKVVGEHKDDNKDHNCDYGCNDKIGVCVDANKDHKCDYGCATQHGKHEDGDDANHECDYCLGDLGEACYENIRDHKCD